MCGGGSMSALFYMLVDERCSEQTVTKCSFHRSTQFSLAHTSRCTSYIADHSCWTEQEIFKNVLFSVELHMWLLHVDKVWHAVSWRSSRRQRDFI